MASIAKNIRKLNRIASGPGALRMPTSIKSVTLQFNPSEPDHEPARAVWRTVLPQLQFHNPQLPISVRRIASEEAVKESKNACELVVELTDGSAQQVALAGLEVPQVVDKLKRFGAEPVAQTDIPVLQIPNEFGI